MWKAITLVTPSSNAVDSAPCTVCWQCGLLSSPLEPGVAHMLWQSAGLLECEQPPCLAGAVGEASAPATLVDGLMGPI